MNNVETIKRWLKYIDVQAETIVAKIAEWGQQTDGNFDPNALFIRTTSLFERGHRKDVVKIEQEDGLIDIAISREGLYDAMPELLFHEPAYANVQSSADRMRKATQKNKKEAELARKFFAPIENEFYLLRSDILYQERKNSYGFTNNNNIFVNFWNIDQWKRGAKNILNAKQTILLLYLLPVAHSIVGNRALTAMCLESILGVPVKIDLAAPKKTQLQDYAPDLAGLGNMTLGADTILVGDFEDGTPSLEIMIGPILKKEVVNYLPGNKDHRLLEELLYPYFFQVGIDIITTITIAEEDQAFKFSETAPIAENGYLGYSVYL